MAEIELVKEAVQSETLDEVFTLFKTLNNPVDTYKAMQKLCRADWYKGVHIDDFFYQLKRQLVHANASLDVGCSILISQLPKVIQSKVK